MTATADLTTALDTRFEIGGREFRSRLMVGTGKYASNAHMIAAIEASGAAGERSTCANPPAAYATRTPRTSRAAWPRDFDPNAVARLVGS